MSPDILGVFGHDVNLLVDGDRWWLKTGDRHNGDIEKFPQMPASSGVSSVLSLNKTFNRYISTIQRDSKLMHYVGSQSTAVYKHHNSQTIPLPIPKGLSIEPREFAWGQSAPGAFLLAFSLLRDVTTQKRAIAAHKAFCQEVISRLGNNWTITAKDLKHWVKVWEAEQRHLASLETAKPKSAAPRSLPFYGVMEATLVSYAYRHIREFVRLAPANQSSSTAMLYLELAVNLAEVRRKTVGSIYWGKANAAARTEVWLQLLMLEQQIGFNLNRFGQWWDAYVEQIPPDFQFPTPDYLTAGMAEVVHHQENERRRIRESIDYLSTFAQKIHERSDRYKPFLRKQRVGEQDA